MAFSHIDEPSLLFAVVALGDLHICALGVACNFQNVAVLLVDDLVAAIALTLELKLLCGCIGGGIDDNVVAIQRQIQAGIHIFDVGDEIGAYISGRNQINECSFGDGKLLSICAVFGGDLNIGHICCCASSYIQCTAGCASGTERILTVLFVDKPFLTLCTGVLPKLHIGTGSGAVAGNCERIASLLVDDNIAAIALTGEAPGLSGGLAAGVHNDIAIVQRQVLTGCTDRANLCMELITQVCNRLGSSSGGCGCGACGVGSDFGNTKSLALGVAVFHGLDCCLSGCRITLNTNNNTGGTLRPEDILAGRTAFIDIPSLSCGVVTVLNDNLGTCRLRSAVQSQDLTGLGIGDLVGAVTLTVELPDLRSGIAGLIGNNICSVQREVQCGGRNIDPGLEACTQVDTGSGHTGFLDTVGSKVLDSCLVVTAKSLLQVSVGIQIGTHAEDSAGLAAFLCAAVQEVLVQLLTVGAKCLLQVGVLGGIVRSVKHDGLYAVGNPVVGAGVQAAAGGSSAGGSGAGGGSAGILIAGLTDINDICIADGIGLGAHCAAVGGNGSRAGVALDGINSTAGITGDDTNVVGGVGVAGGFEINNITGLRCIFTCGNRSSGISLSFVLKPGEAGGCIGVGRHNGGRNTCHMGAPRHEHCAPHILHAVPTAILGVVAAAVSCAGQFGGRAAFLVADLGFCNIYNVSTLIARKFDLSKGSIVLAGPIRRRSAVAQCLRLHGGELQAHYYQQAQGNNTNDGFFHSWVSSL